MRVNVVGAGLAGCEASYQLLKRGVEVYLYDLKPSRFSPAHKNPNFAELVCSNSLKSKNLENAKGLLKQELLLLDSLLLKTAFSVEVPAGGALAVDREKFSEEITKKLKSFSNLHFESCEIDEIDVNTPTIIATGPLTSEKLLNSIKNLPNEDSVHLEPIC